MKFKKSRNNENERTIVQNVWDAAKAILRGNFITVQSYIKKKEKSQINNLTLHVKQLENEEPMKHKISRRKKNQKYQRRNKWNKEKENNYKD